MFTDNSVQFIKHFSLENDPRDSTSQDRNEQNITTPGPQPQVQQFESPVNMNISEIDLNKQLTQSKRLKVVNMLFNKQRKYSQENIMTRDLREVVDQQSLQEIAAKSEASLSITQENQEKPQDPHFQKSDKSVPSKSNRHEVQDIESAFMRKIRNLEARIKYIDLNHETLVSKLKQQSEKHQTQNKNILQFLTQNHPQILQQLNKYLASAVLSQGVNQFSDSSSSARSDKNNEEWMPVMSKIQELRYDGQRMCEKIRNYQQSLQKKLEIQQQLLKQQREKYPLNEQAGKRKGIMRKYSIPVNIINNNINGIREKKEIMQLGLGTGIGGSKWVDNTECVRIEEASFGDCAKGEEQELGPV